MEIARVDDVVPLLVRDRLPWHLWLGIAVAAGLRALPYLHAVRDPGTSAGVLPPIGYNPKDWVAYVAFIREAAAKGGLFLADPFTTMSQDGRYLLLFQDLLGFICRLTGASPFTVLELSRVPLLALALLAFWRLTGVVLTERRERVLACWLLLFSGGFEVLADLGATWIPAQVRETVQQDLWHLQGWNFFAASYNPLWLAGLALTFVTLVPLLRPGGPSGWRDALTVAVGIPVLSWTHSYSGIVIVAVAAARPLVGWVLGAPTPLAGAPATFAGVMAGAGVVALVSRWQRADVVYAVTSNYAFGPQTLPVFWYPITYGAVGFFAVRGWRRWITEGQPAWVGVAAWTIAIVLLHTSPLVGGYHFAFHLSAPVCLAAASGLSPALAGLRARRLGWVAIAAMGVLLFQTPLTLTAKCLREVEDGRVRRSTMHAVEALAPLPPGNVLATMDVGLWVPAYTDHRVFVGQWFLTPSAQQRATAAEAALTGLRAPQLVQLVDAEHIRYIVAPASSAPVVASVLEGRVRRTLPAGQWVVLVLDDATAS